MPADTPAQVCKAADGHRLAGSLDRAKSLYESVNPVDSDQQCAVDGLRLVAEARQDATELVTAGQLMVRSGDLAGAKDKFGAALRLDAGSAAAAAGIARVSDLKSRPLPTAVSNSDRFYRDWALPLGRLVVVAAIGMLVLYALAGLCSRWLVKVDAVAWPAWIRRTMGSVGAFLLFAAAVMAPLFAMFSPFTPTWTECWVGALVIALVGVGAAALVLWAARGDEWRRWRALLLALDVVMLAGILSVLLSSALSYDVRLMFVHIALTVIGVLLTAAALGQNLRLQVEVQQSDGSVNAASSDYLLARMKGLGTETRRSLRKSTSTPGNSPLSQIPVEELSVLPAGKFVGPLIRLFFALRPDLTWRARVTLVDGNRVAISLSRNGQHAASAVFSRPDLRLPEDPDQERAKAQMLTGAAAFILVQLSAVHEELQDGLYGASQWKSVALQVIASSKSLLAEDGTRNATKVGLLAKAVDEDPQNELALFEYLWAAYGLQLHEETDFGGFARAIYAQYDRSEVSKKKARDGDEGWMPLKIRILYSIVTQWLNGYGPVDAGDTDPDADRTEKDKVRDYAAELDRLCDPSKVAWKGKELQHQQAAMHPLARNLLDSLKALLDPLKEGQVTAIHSHEGPPASPRLAYDHACTHMLIARRSGLSAEARQQQMEYAIEDLRYAIVTEDDKKEALGDPCLTGLQSDPRFRRLVNSTGTSGP
ncbi:hypothetical protein [Streptomyces netropsis]|uniref:FtsH-binding integral membrane protein n=1 Tax=Streptomyces netropsis TaxID=55404 RepID=A0A7W7PJ44_STRNE|nr:hypothetical protein [Streptomyces netropsis]MBB4890390.1 FtsH-binding integral membrane protein [Streptomyces netropsis]